MPSRSNTVLLLGCVLGFGAALYAVGNATGSITFVGFEVAGKTQWGFFGREEGISFRMPVWLREGDALQADYEVQAPHGSLLLTVSSINFAPPLVYARAEGQRSGRLLLVAQRSGFYRYGAEPSAWGGRRCPGKRPSADFVTPDPNCPTYEVGYSVIWRIVRHPEEIAADDGQRIRIPREGGTPVWEPVGY